MALDNFRKVNITLNKANQRVLETQIAKVGDANGRELVVQITNNGIIEDQTGTTLKLNWQHENGKQGSTNFDVIDIKTGKFSVYYPMEMLYKGKVNASIEITSNGQITNSMNFKIIVQADVFDGEAGNVDGVFISLAEVNKKLDDREAEYIELKSRQSDVESQFDGIKQEMLEKDVISAPEIIAARNGEATLSERLNKDAEILSSITTVPKIGNLDNNAEIVNGTLDSKTTIQLKGGDFTLSDPIVIDGSKDVVISGQGVDKTILNFEKTMFKINNTLKTEKSINSPIVVGADTIYLDDINDIEVGDLISIKTSEKMEETSRSQIKNHTSVVKDVLTSSITIEHPAPNNFNLDGQLRLLVYKNSGKVIIKDMTLTTNRAGGVVGLYSIDVIGVARPEFRNLKIVNTDGGYQGLTSDNGQISIFRFSETLYPIVDNVEFDSVHYCVMPTSATLGTKVSNSSARNSRHLVAPTGGAQKTKVVDCETFDCYAGFDSHQTAYDTEHINCNSYGDESENKFRGRTDYIQNCNFSGGLIVDNDTALSSELDNLLPIKKTIANTIVKKYFSAKTSVILHIDDIEVLGSFYIQGIRESYTLLNSTISTGENGVIVVWPRGRRVKIDNVKFYGTTKGLSKRSNKITDSGTCIAFNLASSQSFDSIEMSNIEIDGFSNAFSFPVSFNAIDKNMVISKILVKNTSTVLDTVANFKDFLVLENISHYNCFEFSNDLSRFRFPIISKTLGNLTVQGNAIPTVGTWKVGDRVVNASGISNGWVCTTAGTPGVWKDL